MAPSDTSQRPRPSARSRTERPAAERPGNLAITPNDSVRIPFTPAPRRRAGPLASPWVNIRDAAAYLGVGVDTIYAACASRGLKHVKIGHSTIRLRLEWVDAWAETLTRQTP